jgi:hypothetical protein
VGASFVVRSGNAGQGKNHARFERPDPLDLILSFGSFELFVVVSVLARITLIDSITIVAGHDDRKHGEPDPMSKLNEQMLAIRMLETRDRGYSFGLFLRRQRKRYITQFSSFVFMFFIFAAMAPQLPAVGYLPLAFAVGMVCGVYLRDFRWYRVFQSTWRFSVRTTDWKEVERIARGDSPVDFE